MHLRPAPLRLVQALLVAALVSVAGLPAAAGAAATTMPFTGTVNCAYGTGNIRGQVALSLAGAVPASVTPGATFAVSLATASVSVQGGPTFPGSLDTVSGSIADLTLATRNAARPTAAAERLDFGPEPLNNGRGFSAPLRAASGAALQIGPITAGVDGAPIVLRLDRFTLDVVESTGASGVPTITRYSFACTPAEGEKPFVVIPGSAPVPLPVVRSISPSVGPVAGGTPVTITGDNLETAESVNFGQRFGSDLVVVDDHTIRVKTPTNLPYTFAGPGAGFFVEVNSDYGRGGIAEGDAFIAYTGATPPAVRPVAPRVSRLSTDSGPRGTRVTAYGTGLQAVTEVSNRDYPSYSAGVEPEGHTDTQLTFVVPYFGDEAKTFNLSFSDSAWNLTNLASPASGFRYGPYGVIPGGSVPAPTSLGFLGLGDGTVARFAVDFGVPAADRESVIGELLCNDRGITAVDAGVREFYAIDMAAGTYRCVVRLRDGDGHVGPASPAVTVVIPDDRGPDQRAPSSVGAIVPTPASTSVAVSWGAATDDTGVVGYDVFLDDVFVRTVPSTQATLAGLQPATSHTVAVQARDAVGRISTERTQASFTTLAAPAPVRLPVISLVRGTGVAGAGGVFVVSGTRFAGFKGVTIGGRPAVFSLPFGNVILVLGPALPAGKYPVAVRTGTGTSVASAASTATYR